MDKVWILKIGGSIYNDKLAKDKLMKAIANGIKEGYKFILVHGGGALVEEQLSINNMKTGKLDGLRITPIEQVPIIVGALAGTMNKDLQATAIAFGINSIGLSLMDGQIINSIKIDEELGFVGNASPNNPELLEILLKNNYFPIVSSIGVNKEGEILNINADQAAMVIAQLIKGKLLFLSDVSGVLDDNKNLIDELNSDKIKYLIEENVIISGMKVKVEAALEASKYLNSSVQIGSWNQIEQKKWDKINDFGTKIKV